MADEVAVRMGEIAVGKDEGNLLALGLGSCVAVCLYDPAKAIAGLAHVVLPDSSSSVHPGPPGKFADTAVEETVRQMEALGASRKSIRGAIAGGAHVFSFGSRKAPQMDIGARNAAAVRKQLAVLKIPVVAEDCGGSTGRTVALDTSSGVVTVRTVGGQSHEVVRLGYSTDRFAKAA